MSQWYVYLIRTQAGSLYTGITTDVDRRLLEHQQDSLKGAKSLRGKGPLKLAFSIKVPNRSHASKLEAKIKKMNKQHKEDLVAGLRVLPVIEPAISE